MINTALLSHWQNWLYVTFVAVLVLVAMASIQRAKMKKTK